MTRIEPTDYAPDLAVPPGETISELLQELEVPVIDFAYQIGLTEDQGVALIQGDLTIGSELAELLAEYFHLPAQVWINLDQNYRQTLDRLRYDALRSGNLNFARRFPLADMMRFGWIRKSDKRETRAADLLDFLDIASWKDFSTNPMYAIHFRKSQAHTTSDYALVAWLTRGGHLAAEVEVGMFDRVALRDRLGSLRGLTRDEPERFGPLIRSICAECGVAVVFVPAPRQCPVNGAAYKSGGKHVVQLSLRHKRNDIFWFSLFHELAHVILHSDEPFVDDDSSYGQDPREIEADQFAAEVLLPAAAYKEWRTRTSLTREAIVSFADRIGLAPGIVLGRLQRERLLNPERYSDLFQHLDFGN